MCPIALRLLIHVRCARLIECLPSLQHDPNRPEDVLKVDADDAADCLRYLVATKARAVAVGQQAAIRRAFPGVMWRLRP